MNQSVEAPTGNVARQALLRLTRADAIELPAALWAFGYFFFLLAAYYVLRPLRDEMGVQVKDDLQLLFTAVFITMLLLTPVFGWLTARIPRRRLLPWLYVFFIANLIGFFFWHDHAQTDPASAKPLAYVFFVWTSVFNLFAISVFWSFMADVFSTAQAKRLYGFIAAGGTAGAVFGPSIVTTSVAMIGVPAMFLISASLLGVAVLCLLGLKRWATAVDAASGRGQQAEAPIGGGMMAGITEVLRSPYLLGICAFLFLYSLLSTFLYYQQADLVKAAVKTSAERTQLFATADLIVNLLTLAIQVFAFGSLIKRLGTLSLLAAMPIVSIIGFAALASLPTLVTLMVFGILRRTGEYAISKPTRETLFNVLPDEQKYKAKNVIDTVIHRGGDMSSGWIFKGLTSLGVSMAQMCWLSVPIGAVWLGAAWFLGRKHGQLSR